MTENETVRYVRLDTDLVEVTLYGNASTGFRWINASKDDFDLVNVVPSRDYTPTELVGAGMDSTYVLKPKREGELRLRLEYRRTWEKDAPPAQVHEEVIMVEK